MRQTWISLLTSLSLILPLCVAGNARADELQYNQVEFSVNAEITLQNDLAEATLAAEAENTDPSQLATEINRTMAWALNQAHGTSGVEVQSGNYQTYPIYDDKNRFQRWRGSQTLILRSQNVEALNTLIGALQQKLQIKNMAFTVSPERQSAGEAKLYDQVMENFKERAARIQRDLDAKTFRIVRLSVEGAGTPPIPVAARMHVMSEGASVPVASEAGTSRQRLDLRAVIQLTF